MANAVPLLSLVLVLAGVTMGLTALRYKTEKNPLASGMTTSTFHPRNWIPVWRMRDWYSPPGYWLNLVGAIMVCLGALLLSLYYLVVQ